MILLFDMSGGVHDHHGSQRQLIVLLILAYNDTNTVLAVVAEQSGSLLSHPTPQQFGHQKRSRIQPQYCISRFFSSKH